MKILSRYFQLLDSKPYRTKIATALIIFSVGDVSAQYYEHDCAVTKRCSSSVSVSGCTDIPFEWDERRTLGIATFGVGVTSWLHVWWGFLERAVEKQIVSAVSHRFVNAAVKVSIDQLIGSPLFNVFFFSSQSLLQGKSVATTVADVRVRVPEMLRLHYCFWPWVHLVNFSLLPLHRRLLVHNIFTVGWIALLSYKNKKFDDSSGADVADVQQQAGQT
jgi:protein Mpv17